MPSGLQLEEDKLRNLIFQTQAWCGWVRTFHVEWGRCPISNNTLHINIKSTLHHDGGLAHRTPASDAPAPIGRLLA